MDRFFKTSWFAKAASKASIPDEELCSAIRQVLLGQADDLGGGIFKKRLDKNRYRSIIVSKAGEFWVYEFLFAKKDQANITAEGLLNLRGLVKGYRSLTTRQIAEMIENEYWLEICNDKT